MGKYWLREKYKARIKKVCDQYNMPVECIVPSCKGRPIMHHIVSSIKGGTDAISNRMPICSEHERKIHTASAKLSKLKE